MPPADFGRLRRHYSGLPGGSSGEPCRSERTNRRPQKEESNERCQVKPFEGPLGCGDHRARHPQSIARKMPARCNAGVSQDHVIVLRDPKSRPTSRLVDFGKSFGRRQEVASRLAALRPRPDHGDLQHSRGRQAGGPIARWRNVRSTSTRSTQPSPAEGAALHAIEIPSGGRRHLFLQQRAAPTRTLPEAHEEAA